jgi:hypothetical protein
MYWKFVPREITDGASGAGLEGRMIIEAGESISPLEIFVREILQNALDAAMLDSGGHPGQVRIHFKLREIVDKTAKQRFLEAIGWGALQQHVDACNRVRSKQKLPQMFSETNALENQTIQVLEVSDSATIGLTGPEALANESQEVRNKNEPLKAFFALVRDDARREKQGLGAGGTYGKGKAVLWASSAIQTVLFFSRLSVPFEGTIHRAAGQSKLHGHYLNEPFTGVGYGGHREGKLCWAIRDKEARDWAKSIGVDGREDEDNIGTTVIIPFWERPVAPRDFEGRTPHVLIAQFAARYFWPAITDKKLVVTTESPQGKIIEAANELDAYAPFIELYKRVRVGEIGKKDVKPERIEVIVPPFPAMGYKEKKETFALAAMCEVKETEVSDTFCRKVARIRGQGMVIGYWAATGNKVVKPYIGLALGGRAIDSNDSGTYGDLLLGASEGVTHTKWAAHGPALEDWPDAVPPIKRLLHAFENYFEKNSAPDSGPVVDDLSALEEGLTFPGVGKIGPPPPPARGIPVLHAGPLQKGDRCYMFSLQADIKKGSPVCHIDIQVGAGLESGSAGGDDRLPIRNLTVKPALKWETVKTKKGKSLNKVRIHVPGVKSDLKIKITGQTEQLSPELFKVSQGVLRAAAQKKMPAEKIPEAEVVAGQEELEND